MNHVAMHLLFETAGGSVRRCTCCDRVQVTFQHEVLLLDARSFRELMGTARRLAAEVVAADPGLWRLTATNDAGRRCLLMSAEALLALCERLSGAAAMLDLEKLLRETLRTHTGGSPRHPPCAS